MSAIIGAGIVPAAIEMMDALAIEAAEAAVHCGYPAGAGAVLIVELDGPTPRCEHAVRRGRAASAATTAPSRSGSRVDDAERALIWKGRKAAFAAVGRISPDYIVQDGVVPRTALPEVLRRIAAIVGRDGLRVANVFHAGDGNLHPLVLFDDDGARARPSGPRRCPARSSTCASSTAGRSPASTASASTRRSYMPRMFAEDDLDTMQLVRCAFDPGLDLQPRQGVPHAAAVRRGARAAPGAHPLAEAGVAEVF